MCKLTPHQSAFQQLSVSQPPLRSLSWVGSEKVHNHLLGYSFWMPVVLSEGDLSQLREGAMAGDKA